MKNPLINAIYAALTGEEDKRHEEEKTWWDKFMRMGLATLDSGTLTQHSLFGVEGSKKRIMLRNINSRLRWEWRRRQRAKGEWSKPCYTDKRTHKREAAVAQ